MKILLAEDETPMANVLKRALRQKAIAVDHVSNGEDAMNKALVEEYDVILLDEMMPKMKGHEVCEQIRKRGVTTPIIMLSGLGAVPDRITGLDSGADDYMPKPFSFSELMARMRAHMRRKPEFQESVLKVRGLTLDRNSKIVMRSGKKLDLSPKEYRILEFLMRHPGKVLSRFAILENVWGSEDGTPSNVVDVHVSHLRRKLHKGYKTPLLRTVRGQGYLLG